MKIYENEIIFYSEYKSCCKHNCVRQILEYYGFQHSHLLINTSFNFRIDGSKDNPINILREPSEILIGDLNTYLISTDATCKSEEEILKNDYNLLNENIPIITDVDIFYLPYDKHFQKSNSLHSIIVNKIENKKAYIVDVGERTKHVGDIDYKLLLNARRSNNPRGDNIYTGHAIAMKELYIDREISTAQLLHNRSNLYSNAVYENMKNVSKYYKTDNENEGMKAIVLLREYLVKVCTCGRMISYEEIENMYYQLYSINRKRKLFSLSCKILMENSLFVKNAEILYQLISACIAIWEKILSILLKLRFSSKKDILIGRIVEYMKKIINIDNLVREEIFKV